LLPLEEPPVLPPPLLPPLLPPLPPLLPPSPSKPVDDSDAQAFAQQAAAITAAPTSGP
jgi:hypothetical protein